MQIENDFDKEAYIGRSWVSGRVPDMPVSRQISMTD
jgi:hypothetical protein